MQAAQFNSIQTAPENATRREIINVRSWAKFPQLI